MAGFRVFAIVSDGDLMEGVVAEAASLAGHLGLGNLVFLYDDNHVSIDGDTTLAFTEERVGALRRATAGTPRRSRTATTWPRSTPRSPRRSPTEASRR